MGIGTVRQYYIKCDICGEEYTSYSASMEEFRHLMCNKYGWSIGKVVLCQDCVECIVKGRRIPNACKQQAEGREV